MKNLRLKAARAGMDLSQEDLAKICGVSRQTISAIEKGDYNPTINLCVKICKTLGRTLDELFWMDEVEQGSARKQNTRQQATARREMIFPTLCGFLYRYPGSRAPVHRDLAVQAVEQAEARLLGQLHLTDRAAKQAEAWLLGQLHLTDRAAKQAEAWLQGKFHLTVQEVEQAEAGLFGKFHLTVQGSRVRPKHRQVLAFGLTGTTKSKAETPTEPSLRPYSRQQSKAETPTKPGLRPYRNDQK